MNGETDENIHNEQAGFDAEPQAAFMGSTSSAKTMADGSLRISIDLSPGDSIGAFTAFGSPGSAVALARLTNSAAIEEERPKVSPKGPYGNYARDLMKSGFFRAPAVWAGCGTDAEYLDWVKHQPSALSGDFSEWHDDGEAYSIPAHVRRVENGSGTAIKPPYSAIPLTNEEHQRTHLHGDSAIGSETWWEQNRVKYVSDWAWTALKEKLGFESYTLIPPGRIVSWANLHQCEQYLPRIFNGTNPEDPTESES